MKKFAELQKSMEKILEKNVTFVVCFDALVVSASSLSPERKLIPKTCHFFQGFSQRIFEVQQTFSLKVTKIDHHKKRKRLCLVATWFVYAAKCYNFPKFHLNKSFINSPLHLHLLK